MLKPLSVIPLRSALFATLLVTIVSSNLASAADYRKITYQGRVLRPDTSPVTGSVQFRFRITDTAGTCIHWEETQTQTLTDGAFTFAIGSTSPTYDGTSTNNIANVFKQGVAINCQGGIPLVSVTSAAYDDRNISLSFNDGSGWQTLPTQLPLKAVPFAMSAQNAASLGGFALSSTAPTNGQGMIYNSVSGQWEPQNLTGGGTITSVVAGTGLTGGSTTGIATLNVNLTAVLPTQTGQSGKVLSTDGSGNLSWVTSGSASIASNTLLANTTGGTAAPVATTVTQLIDTISSTQGSLLYRNASGWVALPPGTSGQLLRTNGAAANPSWVTATGGSGLAAVSNTATLANGKIWIGDGANLAQEQTLSQDVSVTTTGVATVNRIQNRLVDSTNVAGGVMVWDTATTTWKGKAFPACTTAQTPYWNSGTDSIACQTIAAAWASISGKPTTVSGYGITDAVTGTGTSGTIPKLSAGSTIADSIITENTSKIGISQAVPDTKLHVAGTIKIGDGSETCSIAGNGGMIRYNSNNLQFCNGTSWQTLGVSGAGLTALTGDVTASGTGSVAATVASVGGVTAANVASGANAANAATSNSTVSTIASRDASGVTSFKGIKIDGTTSGTLTINTPATVTSYTLRYPSAVAGAANQVLASDTSGNLSWISLGTAAGTVSLSSQVTGTLPIGNGGTGATSKAAAFDALSPMTTAGDITYGGASGTGTRLAGNTTTVKQFLSSTGTGAAANAPTWGAMATTDMPTYAINSVMTTNSSGVLTASSGSNGQMMTMTSGFPSWTTATYPASTTANQLLYSSANNTVGGLATANSSVLITNGSGVPSWSTLTTDNFTQYVLLAGRSGGQTINGGTAASNNLTLDSTSNGTKGSIFLNPSGGNVGIGTASAPGSLLTVNGNTTIGTQATRSTASNRGQLNLSSTFTQTQASAVTVNWDNGNLQEVASFVCNGTNTITMSNLKDGASYSLLLSGTTAHSGVCVFSSAGFTFKTPGGNVAPTASRDVWFTFAVINGTVVYSMLDNLQ
jgi:trimeric autotransporter adhesin